MASPVYRNRFAHNNHHSGGHFWSASHYTGQASKAISDLGVIEYIVYSHWGDWRHRLYKALGTK